MEDAKSKPIKLKKSVTYKYDIFNDSGKVEGLYIIEEDTQKYTTFVRDPEEKNVKKSCKVILPKVWK